MLLITSVFFASPHTLNDIFYGAYLQKKKKKKKEKEWNDLCVD